MVDDLVAEGVLSSPEVITAFLTIDRRDFVPRDIADQAYLNIPLPVGQGQTISQPYTVAFMLELLQPQSGHTVLDVGYGSGWQTALLASIVGSEGHVTALEIIPELCERGKKNVEKYGFISGGIADMYCRGGREGYEAQSPYDRVIGAATSDTVPRAWLAQTKVGGRIVTPVGSDIVKLVRTREGDWEEHRHPGFAFVPLVNEQD